MITNIILKYKLPGYLVVFDVAAMVAVSHIEVAVFVDDFLTNSVSLVVFVDSAFEKVPFSFINL